MASIAMMISGAIFNAFAFSGSSFLFSHLSGEGERKRHNLAIEKLQHDRDKWNESRLQRIDYINQKLADEGHARRTFQNVDQAMQQYYMLTGEKLEDFPREPHLYDYLDEDQQNSLQTVELAVVGTGILLTGYLAYRFI